MLSHEAGMCFHNDWIGVLRDIRFVADQLVLDAFDITYESESAESPMAQQVTKLSGWNGDRAVVACRSYRIAAHVGRGTKRNRVGGIANSAIHYFDFASIQLPVALNMRNPIGHASHDAYRAFQLDHREVAAKIASNHAALRQ